MKIQKIPKIIIILEKSPTRKKLNKTSDDLLVTLFNLQRKYIGIICNSIARYKVIKFIEETIIKIPNIDSKHKI